MIEKMVINNCRKAMLDNITALDKKTLQQELESHLKLEFAYKDEIDRLNKEKDDLDDYNRHLHNELKKKDNIISELEKYLYNEYLEWKDSENQSLVDKAFEDKEIYDYLKELKEDDNK